jgi:hypothetical protein
MVTATTRGSLANAAFAKRIRSDRRLITAVVGKKPSDD